MSRRRQTERVQLVHTKVELTVVVEMRITRSGPVLYVRMPGEWNFRRFVEASS